MLVIHSILIILFEIVQYLNFVPNLNLRSCAVAGSSEHKEVCKSSKSEDVWDHLSVLKTSLYLTVPLQAVNQSCSCLSRKLIPPLPADAHHLCLPLSFCSFSFFLFLSPSLASSFPQYQSLSLSSPPHRGREASANSSE